MSCSTIDRTPPPPPPPPPKPKPVHHEPAHAAKVDDAKPASHAARANKASATVQQAHREKFAHTSTAKTADHARTSVQHIEQAARAIDRAKTDDQRRAAAVKAARTVSDELQNKLPDEQQRILDGSQAAIGRIGAGLDTLSGDDTQRAVNSLTSAAEAVGPNLARKLTDPIARALPTELEGDGDNRGELLDSVKGSMDAGKGATFGVALAQSAHDVPALVESHLDADLTENVKNGITEAKDNFDGARKTADLLDARLALTVDQWSKGGALSQDAIKAGVDAFKEAHKDEYAAADTASKQLASVLPGAGLASSNDALNNLTQAGVAVGGGRAGVYVGEPDPVGADLQSAAEGALRDVPRIAKSNVGALALSNHVEKNASYLDESKRLLAAGEHPKEDLEAFDNAILKSVAVGGPELVKHGERERLSNLVAGAAHVVNDQHLAKAMQKYQDAIDQLPPDLTGVALGQQLASTATSVARTTLADIDVDAPEGTRLETRFRAVGAAFGLGALAQNALTFDPNDVQSVLGTAGSATQLGISTADLAGKSVGRLGLGVGVVFSAADVGISLSKGDIEGAAAASLPLVGAGVGAIVGGPVGAGIGLAVGGIVATAISLFGTSDSPDEMQEFATEPFIKAAFEKDGVANVDTAASRLRDVDQKDDTFLGVGDSLAGIAKAKGTTPRAILDQLAAMPSNNLHYAVRAILDQKSDGAVDNAATVALLDQLTAMGTNELPFD